MDQFTVLCKSRKLAPNVDGARDRDCFSIVVYANVIAQRRERHDNGPWPRPTLQI